MSGFIKIQENHAALCFICVIEWFKYSLILNVCWFLEDSLHLNV